MTDRDAMIPVTSTVNEIPPVPLGQFEHRLVRASAGTGKTYQLSNRYLALLSRGVEPGEVLATTFTRAAAGEVLGRVMTRLARAAKSQDGTRQLAEELEDPSLTLDTCRSMLNRLVADLHRVSICTIDSFFHKMAATFRYELDLPAGALIVDDRSPIAAALRRQAIDATLEGLASDEGVRVLIDLLRRLHQHDADRRATETIDKIVGGPLYELYRMNPQPGAWSNLEVPGRRLDLHELAGTLEELRDLGCALPKDKNWAKAWKKDREAAERGDWQAFLLQGLTGKIAVGEATYSRKPIPEGFVRVYKPLIEHAVAELIGHLSRQTQATFHLLERFDGHYSRLRRAHGVLLYSDIPMKLATRLPRFDTGRLEEVYYRLDTRVGHLLLDEFQDTSLEQWRVLAPFAQEICAYGDGSRTFFCVGDVKQAIYGWRGGCAELFDKIEEDLRLPHESVVNLNTSYRSSQVVLDAVNRVFANLADNPSLTAFSQTATAWGRRFEPHRAHHRDRPGYVALITSTAPVKGDEDEPAGPDKDGDDTDGGFASAATPHDRFVADLIAQVHHEAPAPGATVGVLVNTNKAVGVLIDLLRRKGLTVSGEGGNRITDDPAVGVIGSALTMADHPSHTAAAFHVYHSPLAEVVGLRSTEPAQVAAVGLAIRRVLVDQGYARVLADWARRLAANCDQRGARRLVQLVELADRFDRQQSSLRPSDFVRTLEQTEVPEFESALVLVMTINKAKGLEFDAVVMTELQRGFGLGKEQMVYVSRESPTGPVRTIIREPNKETRRLSDQVQEAYTQQLNRQVSDDLSKLYVAMTRARHALYMVIKPLKRKKDGQPGAEGWMTASYAAILRRSLSTLGDREDPAGSQTLYTAGDTSWVGALAGQPRSTGQATETDQVRVDLKTPLIASRRSWQRVNPASLWSGGRVRARDLLALQPSVERLRGELIHGWFELIDWLGCAAESPSHLPDDERLLSIAERIVPGVPGADRTWLLTRLNEFRSMLADPEVVEALSKPLLSGTGGRLDLWRERPFAVRVGDRMIQGRFDRVVVAFKNDRPADADLIDFKTVGHPEADIKTRTEQDQPQVEAYRLALVTMLGLPPHRVRARLLFVHAAGSRCVQLCP